MRIIFVILSFWSVLAAAGECEKAVLNPALLDTTGGNIYFNRWSLPDGHKAEVIMNAVIKQVVISERRPLLILDTNPDPRTTQAMNLVLPYFDIEFKGKTYRQLTQADKHRIFSVYLYVANARLKDGILPVFIFDHHFSSPLLSDASTTPLMVDFLIWLNSEPESPERALVLGVIQNAVRLRDHSDADIVLANLAANWAMKPDMLARYGEVMKRIAYFNDHSYLDPSLTQAQRSEALFGYDFLLALEKIIPAKGAGGFEWALTQIPRGLDIIHEVSKQIGENDPGASAKMYAAFERSGAPEFGQVIEFLKRRTEKNARFEEAMASIFRNGGIERRGDTVIVHFPPSEEVPSGLSVMRYLAAHPVAETLNAKFVVLVGRELHADGEYWHVKFRVLDGQATLDPLMDAIRESKHGGGGRSTAGGLYGPVGKQAGDLSELVQDVTWALELLQGRQP